jgi:coenzyme F420-reducing hydrogenase delta subunit
LPGDAAQLSVKIIEFRNIRMPMMKVKPIKLCLFYCSNSLDANALRQSANNMGADELTTISLPCSGKVDLLYLLKAFEKGADGVILITCGQRDCKFLEGNLRAQKRGASVAGILEEIGLDKGRMRVVQKQSEGGIEQIIGEMKSLRESIRNQRQETMK